MAAAAAAGQNNAVIARQLAAFAATVSYSHIHDLGPFILPRLRREQ